ncbi:Translation initiation factor 1A (eIF-1A) [Lasiodiplodia theobromae]|uniref:Putative RNA-binding protein EIF1AD n=1 Tax=Lasiodiplodia theobromae TaxID=45133 RepID=A0A5N5DCJ7_9PEZI|nr:Translation initiation factor [Lasiodiplodia theobromae]KAB2575405.1 putative RNA-binding protein EIF1AD [Lasiodiplodia theobromae]KAF4536764.1 Translation initiation factor [Lasiodiplodia theobromae]KAF9635245.1 Translation initiation factor 1A (eIF-1A) [Lasiodiplodia theobromae]
MGRPKRNLHAVEAETLTPPDALTPAQTIAKVSKAEGNNLYSVELPDKTTTLAELNAKFRSTIWVKRGTYVVIDAGTLAERNNKLGGEIINVVRDEKAWRKMSYWPPEFKKQSAYPEDSDDEESTVGKMPPSDSEDDE